MQPAIIRSVKTGFDVAHRSWSAMALVVGVTVAIGIVAILVIALGALITVGPMARPAPAEAPTRAVQPAPATPPEESFQAPDAVEEPAAEGTDPMASPQAPDAASVEAPEAASPEAVDVAAPADAIDPASIQALPPEELEFDDDLAYDDRPAPADEAVAGALTRAWPVLLLAGLLFGVSLLAVEAGRLGYVAKRVRGHAVDLGEFWRSAKDRFVPLLGAFGLTALALLILGPMWMLTAPLATDPGSRAIGMLLVAVEVGAWVWITVRLGFWWIAVVADRLGPAAGLRASWSVTRRLWWKTFGLWAALGLVSLVASLPLFGLETLGQSVGGPGGGTLLVLTSIGRLLLNTYLAFVVAAALIRYYDDAKAAAGS